MNVYVLKELNVLSSGENDFFVNVYETEEKAKEALNANIEEHIENNSAHITKGKLGDWEVELSDEENNQYVLIIERTKVE